MLGFSRWYLFKMFAAALCIAGISGLALWYFIPAPPSTISIASGIKGFAFEHTALRYRERLAAHGVTLDIRLTEGALDSLRLVNDASSGVDAAFLFGGITNGTQSPRLMSLGRINYGPFWILYRGPETLDRLTQLKGKRIAVGVASSKVINQILGAHGVSPDNSVLLPLIGSDAVKALKVGEVDVIFLPFDLSSPLIQSSLHDPTLRLMNVTQAEALTRTFTFLHQLSLPQGVVDLERNIPANDVNLIALTNVVVVRKDLHPQLVYLLAQTLSEEHGVAGIFQRAGEFPMQNDPEFVIAEEARDFYKNGPSFLQRYLPFWMINFTKRTFAVLLTVIAVVLPLFNYAPKFYQWFLQSYMDKLYSRLRVIEAAMQSELTAPQLETFRIDLETIDRAASILPMRHSGLFLSLMSHIDRVRTRLASRYNELRSQLSDSD